MLHLFITEALGSDLLDHLRGDDRFVGVVRELEAELTPIRRALPCDTVPVLSVFYRGSVVDWYHEATAERIWAQFQEAQQREMDDHMERTPLFAEETA